jgi:predicted nuclease of predicted toxin-antitoxin system
LKLLIDKPISLRTVRLLGSIFPGTQHLRQVGLEGSSQEEILSYAVHYGYVLVTANETYLSLLNAEATDPKVIHLRCSRLIGKHVAGLMKRYISRIYAFGESLDERILLIDEKA